VGKNKRVAVSWMRDRGGGWMYGKGGGLIQLSVEGCKEWEWTGEEKEVGDGFHVWGEKVTGRGAVRVFSNDRVGGLAIHCSKSQVSHGEDDRKNLPQGEKSRRFKKIGWLLEWGGGGTINR